MPEDSRLQPQTLVQGGLFLLLLILLLFFEHSARFTFGALAFVLLVVFHFYIDHAFRVFSEHPSRRDIIAVVLYLLLCTLVVWLTRGDEESPLWIVFFLPIIVAASRFSLRGTLLTCAAALLLFIAHLPARMYLQQQARIEELPELLGFGVMFFLVGSLVHHFARRHRRQLLHTRQLNAQLLDKQGHLERSLEQLAKAEKTLRAKERLASLGELSAGIAHEIRNPLGIISSSAQLLDAELTTPDARLLLDIIQEESTRLNGLISDFLFFGRQLEPQYCECDLAALSERVLESLRAPAATQEVALTFDKRCDRSLTRVDPAMIQQVLLNLLLNALDATAPGGTIQVALSRDAEAFELAVSDSGCGIQEADRDRVFDPFFTTKANGTGLGLANSCKIVHSHAGELKVASRIGRGSTFTLVLPVKDV